LVDQSEKNVEEKTENKKNTQNVHETSKKITDKNQNNLQKTNEYVENLLDKKKKPSMVDVPLNNRA
jgi:hypothetical protein